MHYLHGQWAIRMGMWQLSAAGMDMHSFPIHPCHRQTTCMVSCLITAACVGGPSVMRTDRDVCKVEDDSSDIIQTCSARTCVQVGTDPARRTACFGCVASGAHAWSCAECARRGSTPAAVQACIACLRAIPVGGDTAACIHRAAK